MKKIFSVTLFSLALISMTSCSEENIEEKNSAVITITDPIIDAHIHHNDTLKIRGTIISTMDMHGYETSIRRTDNHMEVYYYDDHYHGMNKNLNLDWPCTVNENVQLELTITAKLDHEGTAAIRSVVFFCEP